MNDGTPAQVRGDDGAGSSETTVANAADTHRSPLRQQLDLTIDELGCSMKSLTVLAAQRDPLRLDTPANHRDGEWLAVTARNLGLGDKIIHLRGLHYLVMTNNAIKPNCLPYTNTNEDWLWLSEKAGKAARWLGYIDFEQIADHRNTPPVVTVYNDDEPGNWINVGLKVELPEPGDLVPTVYADFPVRQPYKLIITGEKSSLAAVLAPVAEQYRADLYLPTGEMSDTMLHQMASIGAADGRRMMVFCFSDADPAGWQMPISIARKLQALKVALFPDLDFEVHRVALTPDQVRGYSLPSSPLKDEEKRADKWRAATGTEQTEVDALLALRPDLLRQIAVNALAPYFDLTLAGRVQAAEDEWCEQAQAVVDGALDQDHLDQLVADAAEQLDQMREQIDQMNNALRIDTDDYDLPEMLVPVAEVTGVANGLPLLDSDWSFADQCQPLIDSKAYLDGSSDE